MSLPLAASAAGNNSPDAYARGLFKPSKDSWSLIFCTEKKNFWDLGLGFSVDVVRIGVCVTIFWIFYDVIARTMSQNCGSKFGWILGCDMSLKRPRPTSWSFWCQSYGQKTGNLV